MINYSSTFNPYSPSGKSVYSAENKKIEGGFFKENTGNMEKASNTSPGIAYMEYSPVIRDTDSTLYNPGHLKEKEEKETSEKVPIPTDFIGRVMSGSIALEPEKMGYHSITPKTKEHVNHPSHYNSKGKETIKVLEDYLSKEEYAGFLKGNILKYIHRYENKNGVEDLNKAKWYLDELIRVS